MKNSIKKLVIVTIIALVTFSFTSIKKEQKDIKIENSKLVWKGYKVAGSHTGTIALQAGSLHFNQDKLVGGEFTINMASITCTDLEGEYKGKLEGHLKSDDFFGVEENPTAKLVFKKVKLIGENSYNITGDLTIKGITNEITFEFLVNGNKANASLKIDRSKFNVKYGSTSFFDNLKDKAISDEFDIMADLQF
ncbi:YceI family protein [uncultured Lutibacter sp.]|uniref:YceI family protein n=1 Tax=uncultured Lutibacter sp. TaxID=437739 RepID=UPI00262001A3|nr:YceI family protein [uncultured Lutibacter sp.]